MPTPPVARPIRRTKERGGTPTTLPRTLLRPGILVLLQEQDDHGYAIIERLFGLWLGGADPGGVYRALRTLEDEGSVRSWWADAERGAPRRVYAITGVGRQELARSLEGLEHQRMVLDELVHRGRGEVGRRPDKREQQSSSPRRLLQPA